MLVLRGHRVHGFVGRSHRVEECFERPLKHFHEGFFNRVALRAAEHAVLEDVRNSGVVLGERTKIAAEHLVFVVGSVDRQHFGARGAMAKELGG